MCFAPHALVIARGAFFPRGGWAGVPSSSVSIPAAAARGRNENPATRAGSSCASTNSVQLAAASEALGGFKRRSGHHLAFGVLIWHDHHS
jgi:hypothetical protein